jgi:myosin heavy subunit
MGTDITDPDPEIMESFKYLVNTTEERIKYQSMPFDGKVQCWIDDEKDGFLAAEIQETKGDDVTVKTSKGTTVTLKKDKIMDMNPPKYYQNEDMADLTYLNEATVFNNLSSRYLAWKIYVRLVLFSKYFHSLK